MLLPSFAVGRAQALMLVLQRLKAAGEIPADLPIFLDSPMAIAATALYQQAPQAAAHPDARGWHAVRRRHTRGQGRAIPEAVSGAWRSGYPSVIISASGMATGGRVLHHLKAMAPNPRHQIVFPGFQVAGTRGARMVAGAPDVKIFGEYVAIKAQVSHLEGFSAMRMRTSSWTGCTASRHAPSHTFVVHGEPEASDTLRLRIADQLGWKVKVPEHLAQVTL